MSDEWAFLDPLSETKSGIQNQNLFREIRSNPVIRGENWLCRRFTAASGIRLTGHSL